MHDITSQPQIQGKYYIFNISCGVNDVRLAVDVDVTTAVEGGSEAVCRRD